MRLAVLAVILSGALFAQRDAADKEQESLQRALGEAGNSPLEFLRALEDHLAHFPDTAKRAEFERALVKTAIDLKDSKRVIIYGERVLARQPNDIQLLQHLGVALLHQGDPVSAEKALGYGRRLQNIEEEAAKSVQSETGRNAARGKEQSDRGIAGALVMQARAEGIMGHPETAIKLAEKSYRTYPSVEAAREAARWYSALGKDEAAIEYLADAFTISELRSPDADKAEDRRRMGELYQKLKGSQTGLGDVILQAYDRTAAQLMAHRAEISALDPNTQLSNTMQFTLSALEGDKLKLSSLLGKVVVMDFWATWCGPCRAQHPLYDRVKTKFKDRDDLVFLSIDTDEDRSLVKPFLQSVEWSQKVYFEDGLSSALQVASIPTTIIFNKKGELVSRMNGFLPDRFVDMLTERIQEALGSPLGKPVEASKQ